MDSATIVLILGVVVAVLGGVDVIRSRAQSATAWGVAVAGVALVILSQ